MDKFPSCIGEKFPGTGACTGDTRNFLVAEEYPEKADVGSVCTQSYMRGCANHIHIAKAVEDAVKRQRPHADLSAEEIQELEASFADPKLRPATAKEFDDMRIPIYCPDCKSQASRMPIVDIRSTVVCCSPFCTFKESQSLVASMAPELSGGPRRALVEDTTARLMAKHPDVYFLPLGPRT